MNTLSYKTVSAKKSTVKKEWVVLDAKDQSLGRVASIAAQYLKGKHKPSYTPHIDCGDNVIIINAAEVHLSGKKWTEKEYIRYTGHPGGQRSLTAEQLYKKNPTRLIENAVKGMLPKNRLGSALFRNLRVFNDDQHTLQAQQPKVINVNELI